MEQTAGQTLIKGQLNVTACRRNVWGAVFNAKSTCGAEPTHMDAKQYLSTLLIVKCVPFNKSWKKVTEVGKSGGNEVIETSRVHSRLSKSAFEKWPNLRNALKAIASRSTTLGATDTWMKAAEQSTKEMLLLDKLLESLFEWCAWRTGSAEFWIWLVPEHFLRNGYCASPSACARPCWIKLTLGRTLSVHDSTVTLVGALETFSNWCKNPKEDDMFGFRPAASERDIGTKTLKTRDKRLKQLVVTMINSAARPYLTVSDCVQVQNYFSRQVFARSHRWSQSTWEWRRGALNMNTRLSLCHSVPLSLSVTNTRAGLIKVAASRRRTKSKIGRACSAWMHETTMECRGAGK